MIRSMTGFGRAAFAVEGVSFTVEVRTVNHRHLDLAVRLPRPLASLEPDVRRVLRERFDRGKVDLSAGFAPGAPPRSDLQIDRELALRYVDFAEALAAERGLAAGLDAGRVLALPGVARVAEHALAPEAVAPALREAATEAAEQADRMRRAEGEALDRELRGRLARVRALCGGIGARAPEVVEAARERLRKRAEQLRDETGGLDEARLHQEVVLAADRLDVTEELVRLESHAAQFETVMGEAAPGHPVGRRLEFLLQEMVRETNTTGAKAGDAPLAHGVVDLKTELERLREQVLNVE
ncbi:MAG: YicC/YloC family endoribonuclease [Myxococcota bacterium]|nr:YicC/YloC family endoribonuclease [Myxococcota bacterium]